MKKNNPQNVLQGDKLRMYKTFYLYDLKKQEHDMVWGPSVGIDITVS